MIIKSKYIFKKSNEKIVSDLLTEITEKYYTKLSKIEDSEMRLLFINIISEISNSIFDFYVNVNRTNNVFYYNVNRLSDKLIKDIFTLNVTYYLFRLLDDDEISENEVMECMFQTFQFSKRNKKLFYKYYNMYKVEADEFLLDFIHIFSKKVFSTKNANRMEFIYIDHYLETSYISFRRGLENFLVEA